jgi:hypothetical protein
MELCKNSKRCIASIMEGVNKGKQCRAPAVDNNYCLKHNKYTSEKNRLESEGNRLCASVHNRCLNIIDIKSESKYCSSCKEKKRIKKFNCKHLGCKFNVFEENTYCKLHILDEFRDYEKENNVKFCKINRNCRNLRKDKSNICEICKTKKGEIINQIRIDKNIQSNYIPISKLLNEYQNKYVYDIEENWRLVLRGAFVRNILFNLSFMEYLDIVINPCEYCGFISQYKVNGLDRIDNDKGYFKENVKSCCFVCNKIKGNQKLHEFISKVKAIVKYQNEKIPISQELINIFKTTYCRFNKCGFGEYVSNAIHYRNIDFCLTKEEYFDIIKKDCYLCGIQTNEFNINGIDRLFSNEGYSLENCRPCCCHCNYSKNNLDFNIFLDKCKEINIYCADKFTDLENDKIKNLRNQKRNEVYSIDEICCFIKENKGNKYINWCLNGEINNKYVIRIKEINENYLKDQNDEILKINLINLENNKDECFLSSNLEIKNKINCTSLMLFDHITTGKKDVFYKLYCENNNKSDLFDEKYKKLCDKILLLDVDKQKYKCNRFIYREKKRQLNRNFFYDKKEIDELKKYKEVSVNNKGNRFNRIVNDMNKYDSLKEKITIYKKEKIPKDWKASNIYNYIIDNKENLFYDYLVDKNKNFKVFYKDLDKVINDVKLNKDNKDKCINLIKNLLTDYRKKRTLLLLSKPK